MMTIYDALNEIAGLQIVAALKYKEYGVGLSVYSTGSKFNLCAHRKENGHGKTQWCNVSLGFSSNEKAIERKIEKVKKFLCYGD